MKESNEYQFSPDVKYFEEHTWAREEGENIVVGISDYAQDQLGEIIYVELPDPGTSLNKNDVFGTVESVKTSSELYMPISGTVITVNESLEDEPETVNTQPYGEGWMITVKPSDPVELIESLLSAEQYSQLVLGDS